MLKPHFKVLYDQQGSIGKRYYRQDEAGTPFGITVDHQSIEDNTVTLRHRDTMVQNRVSIDQIQSAIQDKM
jgi:glycyl-tRNA synthetase